jgi:hypothetical protein
MGLGSGIRKKPIPDPGSRIQDPGGVKKAPDPGSGSATLPTDDDITAVACTSAVVGIRVSDPDPYPDPDPDPDPDPH